jgi:hypothetical protein
MQGAAGPVLRNPASIPSRDANKSASERPLLECGGSAICEDVAGESGPGLSLHPPAFK